MTARHETRDCFKLKVESLKLKVALSDARKLPRPAGTPSPSTSSGSGGTIGILWRFRCTQLRVCISPTSLCAGHSHCRMRTQDCETRALHRHCEAGAKGVVRLQPQQSFRWKISFKANFYYINNRFYQNRSRIRV